MAALILGSLCLLLGLVIRSSSSDAEAPDSDVIIRAHRRNSSGLILLGAILLLVGVVSLVIRS